MDFSNPSLLISGFIISMVGMGIFMYGKRAQSLKGLAIGIVMMGFPIFVSSLLWMWVSAGACVAGMYLLPHDV